MPVDINSLDHFWVIKWLQVVPGKLELIRKSKSGKAHHVYLGRVQLHPLFWIWKDCGSKHPPGDRLLSIQKPPHFLGSHIHGFMGILVPFSLWTPKRLWGFWGSWLQKLPTWIAAGVWDLGRAGSSLNWLLSLLDSSFVNVHNPRGPHVHGFYSVTHTRLSMNLFVKSLMQKNPPYIERKDIKVWWAFALETQKLEFLFWLICQFAWCPWVSHEISLGFGFIISKKGNHYTTYLLGVLYKE